MKSLRSWKIIGVVGKSNTNDPVLLDDAYKVGAHLAKLGHAVLTGGHHRHNERSVKYHALRGAISLQNELTCVRLIGVVPKNISDQLTPPITAQIIEPDVDPNARLRYVYIHTQLKSAERDPITGEVADALIALRGESGTPREVAAALMADRPVVFFNSLESLRDRTVAELDQHGAKEKFPTNPLVAVSVNQAVDLALESVDSQYDEPKLSKIPTLTKAFIEALKLM